MAGSPKRVAWDACAWIARIQKEKIRDENDVVIEDREAMCRAVLHAAEAGKVEIVTSALCLVEVNKDPAVKAEDDPDDIAAYFEHDFVILANLDRFVGERARELMRAGYSRLKPPDAVHIATAALANVVELHTFDERLLNLNELIDKADGRSSKSANPILATLCRCSNMPKAKRTPLPMPAKNTSQKTTSTSRLSSNKGNRERAEPLGPIPFDEALKRLLSAPPVHRPTKKNKELGG
jgi:predicted nucleic acid-binding protein